MKNLDTLKAEKAQIIQRINDAMKEGNDEAFAQAFSDFQDNLQQTVLNEAKGYQESVDASILAARGVRQLTTAERAYFTELCEAMRSNNPQQAVTNMEVVLPTTTINAVFDDLQANHPLLSAIDFQNTSGMIEFITDTSDTQLATWGALTDKIVKELTGGFTKVNLMLDKLSAFIPVAKSMLDLGPEWLEKYVRTLLSEALAIGLEHGIVNGTGKNEPIGMMRQVGDEVSVSGGIYPEKAPVKVTALDPVTYGTLTAKLAVTPKGKSRKVTGVLLVVNPADYLTKIFPATTVRAADGTYTTNVFPFPTTVVQSTEVPSGRAVFGLPGRYFMGAGLNKSGKIEYSDEYHFLEDERVYLTKFYGHGMPKDNNAFLVLDITGMAPAVKEVRVHNTNPAPVLGTVNVVSEAGGNGKTKLSVSPAAPKGCKYKTKTGASVDMPALDAVCTAGYEDWDGKAEVTATTGHQIMVVVVDAEDKAKAAGITEAVSGKA